MTWSGVLIHAHKSQNADTLYSSAYDTRNACELPDGEVLAKPFFLPGDPFLSKNGFSAGESGSGSGSDSMPTPTTALVMDGNSATIDNNVGAAGHLALSALLPIAIVSQFL